ncbi:DUF4870 domain-containing protein [Candidatus Omnitrophota bacterium]
MAEDKEVREGKMFAVLAYLSILCFLPLILKKDNKFAFHHGKQGLVIFLGEVALGVLAWIPLLGWVLAPLGALLLFVLSLVGLIQALMGNYWKCPVVAELADKIKL